MDDCLSGIAFLHDFSCSKRSRACLPHSGSPAWMIVASIPHPSAVHALRANTWFEFMPPSLHHASLSHDRVASSPTGEESRRLAQLSSLRLVLTPALPDAAYQHDERRQQCENQKGAEAQAEDDGCRERPLKPRSSAKSQRQRQ